MTACEFFDCVRSIKVLHDRHQAEGLTDQEMRMAASLCIWADVYCRVHKIDFKDAYRLI